MSSDKCFERDLIGDTSEHDRGASLWLASSARAAATSRLMLLGGAVVSLIAISTWSATALWTLPVVFILVLFTKLLDGSARQAALRLARVMPMRLPDATVFSDLGVREVMQRLERARAAIAGVLDSGPRGPGFDLASLLSHVPRLERAAVVLAQRAEYVSRFLAEHPDSDLATEDLRQAERVEREQDPARASEMRRVITHLKARLEASTALKREYEALLAGAKDALGALEALPARMTLLQVRRIQACDDPSAEEGAAVGSIDESLREIERVLAADRSPEQEETAS